MESKDRSLYIRNDNSVQEIGISKYKIIFTNKDKRLKRYLNFPWIIS
jgi:hypothetical protein